MISGEATKEKDQILILTSEFKSLPIAGGGEG